MFAIGHNREGVFFWDKADIYREKSDGWASSPQEVVEILLVDGEIIRRRFLTR